MSFSIKGVDISGYNGKVDFKALSASEIKFVIIRLGYGGDYSAQDDRNWREYVEGCEKYNIPYGLYLYSYALNNANVDSEINHALRIARQCKPTLGIWFDMEDADAYKKKHGINVYANRQLITGFCTRFCDAMIRAGYKTGIYSSADYWKNVLTAEAQKYDAWVAMWAGITNGDSKAKPPTVAKYMKMWQYAGSCSGVKVAGSSTANDLNYCSDDFLGGSVKPTPAPTPTPTPAPTPTPTPTPTAPTITAGKQIQLNKAPLYVSSVATAKSNTVTGSYYLWDNKIIKNRVRITTKKEYVGNVKAVTGWIDVKEVK